MENSGAVIVLLIVFLILGCNIGITKNINSTNKIERQIESLQTQGCKEEWNRYYGEQKEEL
jgi:F0F1-type ATP synthase assembly protein I